MPSLLELQRAFAELAFSGDDTRIEELGIYGGGVAAGARFAVYRRNVHGNYRKALAASFPVVRRLVGEPFFGAAVDAFVRQHPSTRGDINGYGEDLPAFLESYVPAGDLPYLADVARLEWAIDQAGIAADASALDLAALGAVPADDHAQLRFILHPSVRLIRSPYPIFRIWQVNQTTWTGSQAVDLEQAAGPLLVTRGDDGVTLSQLSAAEAALLDAIRHGATLGEAAASANAVEPRFDLTVSLRRLVVDCVIAGFVPPSRESSRQ